MADRIACSQYDPKKHVCKSGHVPLTGICFGCDGSVPPCMQEDRPAIFIRGDGLPMNWPQEPTNDR